MATAQRNWSVSPFTTWRHRWGSRLSGTASRDNHLTDKVQLEGATITDKDAGLIYEATVGQADGRVWLTSLTILTTREGQRLDQSTLRRVPVQRIAEQVSLHLAQQQSAGMAVFAPKRHREKQDGPSMSDVVREWQIGGGRKAIAQRLNMSPNTLDNHVRAARDAGLISEAKTGRKRKPKTPAPSAEAPDPHGSSDR